MTDPWRRRFVPNATARPVENGLKARSKRGAIAQTWWSARFIEVLEAIVVGGRLDRGRAYARKGQVVSMEVKPGAVTARVQGSERTPYRVRVGLPVFTKAEWRRVEDALAGSAWYLAKLLAGEMPEDIEEVFAGQGLSLFPEHADALTMSCSCPDWSVPCKHIAAAFYLLAESFDEDPFRILAWRGRGRDALLRQLTETAPAERATEAVDATPESLDGWFAPRADVVPPAIHQTAGDALLDQLPPVVVRGQALTELLRPAYLALGE